MKIWCNKGNTNLFLQKYNLHTFDIFLLNNVFLNNKLMEILKQNLKCVDARTKSLHWSKIHDDDMNGIKISMIMFEMLLYT